MTTWQEFLVEHAKFPFPAPVENGTVTTTDVSDLQIGLLTQEWRAQYAVRDETLVQKLCQTFKEIIGDALIPDGSEDQLLSKFGKHLQFETYGTRVVEYREWCENENESDVRIPDSHSRLAGLTLGTESVIVKHRLFSSRKHVYGLLWIQLSQRQGGLLQG